MRNPSDQIDSPLDNRFHSSDDALKDERNADFSKAQVLFSPPHPDQAVPENPISSVTEQSSRESPVINGYKSQVSSSDTEQTRFIKSPITSKHQKQKVYISSSSSSPSEKHGRGLKILFSRGKGK